MSTKAQPLSNSWPLGNFQKSDPDPPLGKCLKLIQGGWSGGCIQLELTETLQANIVMLILDVPMRSVVAPSFTCVGMSILPCQCPYKTCHKITVVSLSGIASLAFSDENAGFHSGFFKIINSTGSRQRKIETDISNSLLKQQVSQMARTADHCQSCLMIELSNICLVFVFEYGRPGLQSSNLPTELKNPLIV